MLIAFVPPALFVLAWHHWVATGISGFTIKNDLPVRGVQAIFVVLATWVAARMAHRPLADFAMPPRQALGLRFWEGCMWGFAMLSTVLLLIRLTGHLQIDGLALSGSEIFKYAVGWALVFLCVAINEEFIFRGYLLFQFMRRVGFWRASIFLSLAFGAAHLGNHGENVIGIVQVVLVGLIFCFTIRRTGTIWMALGFHTTWDWAQSFFYGTPDSGLLSVGRLLNTTSEGPKWLTGGSAGPEGSVIAIAVLLMFALLVHLRFPKVQYPPWPEK
jgi:uncharacterized protein